jgi:hypothetical protein
MAPLGLPQARFAIRPDYVVGYSCYVKEATMTAPIYFDTVVFWRKVTFINQTTSKKSISLSVLFQSLKPSGNILQYVGHRT